MAVALEVIKAAYQVMYTGMVSSSHHPPCTLISSLSPSPNFFSVVDPEGKWEAGRSPASSLNKFFPPHT